MRFSKLQKHILLECWGRKHRLNKKELLEFYFERQIKLHKKEIQDIVTRSIQSLIKKGCLIGYGRRTPQRWYIKEIHLTLQGRREARKLLGKQQRLPF